MAYQVTARDSANVHFGSFVRHSVRLAVWRIGNIFGGVNNVEPGE